MLVVNSEELWDQCKCWQPGNHQKPTNRMLLWSFFWPHVLTFLVTTCASCPRSGCLAVAGSAMLSSSYKFCNVECAQWRKSQTNTITVIMHPRRQTIWENTWTWKGKRLFKCTMQATSVCSYKRLKPQKCEPSKDQNRWFTCFCSTSTFMYHHNPIPQCSTFTLKYWFSMLPKTTNLEMLP